VVLVRGPAGIGKSALIARFLHDVANQSEVRAVFGRGTAMAILFLAANTAFADFPRLSSIIARDGYLSPHRGDRLVFSNGVLVLALAAAVLLAARAPRH